MREFSTVLLVVAVALIGEDGRVLLQKRRPDAEHGGLWEFPGGKVEPGERPEEAAVREIAEELGIVLEPAALAPITFASGMTGPGDHARPLVILLYACRQWSGEPECRDGEAIAWLAPREISGLAMPPLDYPLARALLSAMRTNKALAKPE